MSLPSYAPPPSAFKDTSVRGGHRPSGPKPEEYKQPVVPFILCDTCSTCFNLTQAQADDPVYVGLLKEIHKLRDNRTHVLRVQLR